MLRLYRKISAVQTEYSASFNKNLLAYLKVRNTVQVKHEVRWLWPPHCSYFPFSIPRVLLQRILIAFILFSFIFSLFLEQSYCNPHLVLLSSISNWAAALAHATCIHAVPHQMHLTFLWSSQTISLGQYSNLTARTMSTSMPKRNCLSYSLTNSDAVAKRCHISTLPSSSNIHSHRHFHFLLSVIAFFHTNEFGSLELPLFLTN